MRRMLIPLLACALMVGCSLAQVMHDSDSANVRGLGDLKDGQAILVGRIELDPARGKSEPVIETNGSWMPESVKDMLKEANLYLGRAVGPQKGEPEKGDYTAVIKAHFGDLFFARLDPGSAYLQSMSYVVRYGSNITHKTDGSAQGMQQRIAKAAMRLNSKIAIQAGDQVIYVGRLRFKRDEFNNFKGLQVIDESGVDLKAIRDKLGATVKVRKVLVTAN